MTLRHLEVFLCVMKHSSISKAANELHISQPSVSISIKELESEYQTELFYRSKRKIFPTKSAIQLSQYANHILNLVEEMNNTMHSFNELHITIGCSFAISQFILPTLLVEFQNSYPNIKFSIIIDNSTTIENKLLINQIDFALLETDPISKDIIKIPFYKDYLETICNINHPLLNKKQVNLNDLLDYPYYTREKGSSVSKLVNSVFTTNQLQLLLAIQSANSTSLIELVSKTNGISTLPYAMIESSLKSKNISILNINELHIKRTYHIIYHKNKFIPPVYHDLFNKCIAKYK